MKRSRVINSVGLGFDRRRARRRADHQVPRRRMDRHASDDRLLPDHARPSNATTTASQRSSRPTTTTGHAHPGARDRPGLQLHKPTLRALAYAKANRPNVLEGVKVAVDAALDQQVPGGVGRPEHRRPAEGAGLAVPGGGQADRRLHQGDPEGQPARGRRGLHPGVRRRSVVGAAPAQPDGAAAQGPAALHAGRDGDVGALPAPVQRDRPRARGARDHPGARRRPEARSRGRRAPAPTDPAFAEVRLWVASELGPGTGGAHGTDGRSSTRAKPTPKIESVTRPYDRESPGLERRGDPTPEGVQHEVQGLEAERPQVGDGVGGVGGESGPQEEAERERAQDGDDGDHRGPLNPVPATGRRAGENIRTIVARDRRPRRRRAP